MTYRETLEWIEQLNADPDIEHASPNYLYSSATLSTAGVDFDDDQRWHYELIGAPEAWEAGFDGEGARIAVMDSGVYRSEGNHRWHTDLDANIDCAGAGCFDALDGGGNLPVDSDDVDFHGTHVSGTASAVGGEGRPIGVAFASTLLPVRVLDGREGTLEDIIEGIAWAIGNGERRADVINLSLGAAVDSQPLEDALIDAREAGITVVAAAGNQASDRDFFPAAYPSTISVSSVNCESNLSSFSSFGLWTDIAAPGGGGGDNNSCNGRSHVISTVGNDDVGGLRGTSMAAPHVAGAIALIKAELGDALRDGPDVMQALLREQLVTDGDDVHDEELGWGILDIATLESVTENLGEWRFLSPRPRRLSVVPGIGEYTLNLDEVGSLNDTVTQVSVALVEEVPWLEIEEVSAREYDVRLIDSELNASNVRRTDLEVTYETQNRESEGRFTIPVAVEESRDASPHWITLIPEDDDLDVEAWLVEASNNRYELNLDPADLAPGRYRVVIGSDLDGDGVLCVPGEACDNFTANNGGSKIINVHADSRHDLEFTTRYIEEWQE